MIGKITQLTSMINILPEDEQKKEKILHAIKKIAQMQMMLNTAIDELFKELQ